jgi:hypothetical protein
METLAIWNVNETAKMPEETNLRNVCRQIEDEYITWGRFVSEVTGIQWPAIGELGRYGVEGAVLTFVKHRRYVDVKDAENKVIGTVPVHPGMARELYALAGTIADRR